VTGKAAAQSRRIHRFAGVELRETPAARRSVFGNARFASGAFRRGEPGFDIRGGDRGGSRNAG
jgi:hypothetical protein